MGSFIYILKNEPCTDSNQTLGMILMILLIF